ncbi:MAG: ATP-grasp domain-containing protein [Planctomycetes bacterium]|nr:ATP-grasp domain-containing protein [Planctomycetota bacterium]
MHIALVFNAKGSYPPVPVGGPTPRQLRGGLSEEEYFAECDSPPTVDALARAIASGGHRVTKLDAGATLYRSLVSGRFDLVFNLAEGLRGEAREAQVPALLEYLGIPYTGSGPIALALAHDKSRAKQVWQSCGLAVPRGIIAFPGEPMPALPKSHAWIVKPVAEGSSKGVHNSNVVRSRAAAAARVRHIHKHYRQPALVEELLEGREFTVALLGNPPRVLPIVEINFDALPKGAERVYSYEAKWHWDVPENPLKIFECPARLDRKLERAIGRLAVSAFQSLGCRDWARVDIRLDGRGTPHLIEINPLPGILPNPEENSCFPKAARAAGLRYEDAILAVVDAAAARWGMRATRRKTRRVAGASRRSR